MKALTGFITILIISITVHAETCMVLPLHCSSDISESQVVHELFVEAFTAGYAGTVSEPDNVTGCKNTACALEKAQQTGADRVVYTALRKLGSKLIMSGTIVTVSSGAAHSVRATGTSIEDMEFVTKRVADALVTGKTLEEAVTTDNITATEEHKEPVRRKGLYLTGLSVGYLFPVNNSYRIEGYDVDWRYNSSWNGVDTAVVTPDHTDFRQLIKLNWRNWFEFRDNMVVSGDFHWLIPVAIGGRLNFHYLTNRGDFTPFLVGGLGIEYAFDWNDGEYIDDNDVVIGEYEEQEDKRRSGPTLSLGAGFLAFRTYDIHVLGQITYDVTFNDDFDNGVSMEIGTVYRPAKKERSSDEKWSSSTCLYSAAGLVLMSALLSGI